LNRLPPDRRILELLASIPALQFEDSVWRILPAEVPPLEPTVRRARWNVDERDTIYSSLERTTAIVEVRNRLEEEVPRRNKPHTVHRIEVRLTRVLDLRATDVIERLCAVVGPISLEIEAGSQMVGEAAAWSRHDGLIVPSMRTEGSNLVLFPDIVEAAHGRIEVIESERMDIRREKGPHR